MVYVTDSHYKHNGKLQMITACTVVQAVVKANRKSNGKIVMFCDHMFLVVR